jgi:hypothetical protein
MAGIKSQIKQAEKKIKGKGALMTEREKKELLGLVSTKPTKAMKSQPKYMPK